MKRIPIVATIIVGLAVAAMIGLGVWQLQRRGEKLAELKILAANPSKPPITFPQPPIGDDLLFRHAGAVCLKVSSFKLEGAGKAGFRVIARCSTGAEGPGFAVQLGTTMDPAFKPVWRGGKVNGMISHAPSATPLIAALFGKQPSKELMLVASNPAPRLTANPTPSLDSVANNHLAYAVQWFLFAGIASVIYVLALRRRRAKG